MSRWVRYLFLVHAVVALVFGVLLLVIPGRFLGWLGWAPIDPILSRLLGAAILGLSWSSFRGWRASEWRQVAILVEAEAIYCVLACAGLLRHLVEGNWPAMVWALFGVYAAFAIAWIVALLRHKA